MKMGVPKWTADGKFYNCSHDTRSQIWARDLNHPCTYEDELPCWSVGRLIEIAFICSVYEVRTIEFWRNDPPMDDIIYEFENNKMDFSKLNDNASES